MELLSNILHRQIPSSDPSSPKTPPLPPLNMSPPQSPLFRIEPIPNAGRGVIATQTIPQGTSLLQSDPPAAHVIFRQYRKEVCALCFHYDLGRTLSVRHAATGKVFCSAKCQTRWLEEQGELGVRASGNVHAFVLARSKDAANADSYECLPDRGGRPSAEAVASVWWDGEVERSRERERNGGKKPGRSNSSNTGNRVLVDPDVLSFLLSSILHYHRDLDLWLKKVQALARDPSPYRSTHELSVYRDSFHQLRLLLPPVLQQVCKPQTCHLAVAAASHNSFGIRSEDGEEYMGYALYPEASYFNHSCAPNVAKVRVGRRWVFSAEREIGAGEECCITYLGGEERELDVRERRARLREHWGFECMCVRCRVESP